MEPVLRRFPFASVKDPGRCRLDPREAQDRVLALILERAGAGSRPGARSDPYSVCLAIEGGGMRGSVSAGMCLMLKTTGVVASFDRIYGCSAGALNGSYLASGQASLAASTYTDAAKRRYIDRRRLMRGRPIVNLDLLFEELLAARRPHSRAGRVRGPDVRAVAVSPPAGEVRAIGDLRDTDELLRAVRVSCAVPMISGEPPPFRGERLLEGGFVESIPYRTAVRDDATHVPALRSRPADYRLAPISRVTELAVRRAHPDLSRLVAARPGRYMTSRLSGRPCTTRRRRRPSRSARCKHNHWRST